MVREVRQLDRRLALGFELKYFSVNGDHGAGVRAWSFALGGTCCTIGIT